MNNKQNVEIPRELVLRAQAGDRDAFSELYQRSGAAIYRTICSMVQDEDLAWDIHQNSYIRAYNGLSKLEKPEAFLPWLRRIAVNEAIKALNKTQPLTFTELSGPEGEDPQFPETRDGYQPDVEIDKQEAARLVREILEKLPQKQRLILGMYYYEEYNIREIADALQVTQGTVKTQLHLGRKKVEAAVRRLEAEGVRLYGLSPMAFLTALLGKQEPVRRTGTQAAKALLEKAAPSGGEPVVLTAKAVGSGFFHTALGRVTAVVLAAAVTAGGVMGWRALRERLNAPISDFQPVKTAEIDTVSEPSSNPTEAQTENATEAPTAAQMEASTEAQTEALTETHTEATGPDTEVTILHPSQILDTLFFDYSEAEAALAYADDDFYFSNLFYCQNIIIGDGLWSGLETEYTASSVLKEASTDYSANHLGNLFLQDCWCENVPGMGVGETIEVSAFASSEHVDYYCFDKYYEGERGNEPVTVDDVKDYLLNGYNQTHAQYNEIHPDSPFPVITEENLSDYKNELHQIAIINGYAKTDSLWKNNGRVKTLKLTIDDQEEYILELEDRKELQLFDIDYQNASITQVLHLKFEILETYPGEKYQDTCLTSLYLSGGTSVPWGGR